MEILVQAFIYVALCMVCCYLIGIAAGFLLGALGIIVKYLLRIAVFIIVIGGVLGGVTIYAPVIWIIVGAAGCLVAVWNFLATACQTYRQRIQRNKPKEYKESYDTENYFYWNGAWQDDFKTIVSTAWLRNRRSSAYACAKANGCWHNKLIIMPIAFFWLVWTLCLWICSLALLPAFTIILGGLTLAMLSFSYLVAFGLNITEQLYIKIFRFQFLCPSCHRPPRGHVPDYQCPRCRKLQRDLMPGARYGAFYRVCASCGTHLPASRLFGRHKLTAVCSHEDCRQPFDKLIESTALNTIAFIGSPGAGKTTMLMDLVCMLTQNLLPERRWKISYPTPSDKQRVEAFSEQMASDAMQQSTRGNVQVLCIDARRILGATQRLYFYDPPGEIFGKTDAISAQLYYRCLRAALLVIDPFSIPEIQKIQRKQFPEENMQPCDVSPDEGLGRWLISLERDFSSKGRAFSCALIINKTDSPGLQRFCHIRPSANEADCYQFMDRFGLGNMVENLRNSFDSFHIFAVSARPSAAEGKNNPLGMNAVASWVIEQLCL